MALYGLAKSTTPFVTDARAVCVDSRLSHRIGATFELCAQFGDADRHILCIVNKKRYTEKNSEFINCEDSDLGGVSLTLLFVMWGINEHLLF